MIALRCGDGVIIVGVEFVGISIGGWGFPSLGFARPVWQTPNRANPFSPARGEKDRADCTLEA
jgi:hypothetical protein